MSDGAQLERQKIRKLIIDAYVDAIMTFYDLGYKWNADERRWEQPR